MTRFFVPEPLSSVAVHPLVAFRFGADVPWRGPFIKNVASDFFEKDVVYVERPEDADAILLPNNFTVSNAETDIYIQRYADEAQEKGIPLYLFSFSDFSDGLVFEPRAKVFRLSVYRSTKRPQDIIVPTVAEEFGPESVVLRKKASIPTVSFCGFAGFKTTLQWVKYGLKNLFWEFRALGRPPLRARKQGVYWRRAAMRVLTHSALVKTHFIVRRSFSGALRTIELPPEQARKEFIDSIIESDFVLTPKGDGNYSNRFLEVLSLGRIPVIIDTDTILPFEDRIDYSKIVVRVPMEHIANTAQYIREFYDALSEEEWKSRQELAYETFEKYLRQDAFFRAFFSRVVR